MARPTMDDLRRLAANAEQVKRDRAAFDDQLAIVQAVVEWYEEDEGLCPFCAADVDEPEEHREDCPGPKVAAYIERHGLVVIRAEPSAESRPPGRRERGE